MKKYGLAPYVRVGFQNDTLYVGFGSMQFTEASPARQKQILMLLAKTRDSFIDKESVMDHAAALEISDVAKRLFERGFFIEEGLYNREDRYSRQWLYYNMQPQTDPREVQAKLSEKHVVILGTGGIGNLISPMLATAGIKRLTLVDGDTIELSNLTRQYLFDESMVGSPKATNLKDALLARNSKVTIDTITTNIDTIQDLDVLPDCDLIVLSADDAHLLHAVNRYACKTGTPFINVGYVQDIAVWGPFVVPGKTGCIACCENLANSNTHQDENLQTLLKTVNRTYQAPSCGPVNMLGSSLAALDILRFLGDFGEIHSLNKRVGLWSHDMHFEEQRYDKNPHCTLCSNL